MGNLTYLAGYGCETAAGSGPAALWQALTKGTTESSARAPTGMVQWPVVPSDLPTVFQWPLTPKAATVKDLLVSQLMQAFRSCRASSAFELNNYGVIFASTKGYIEDWVWEFDQPIAPTDSLQPVLDEFLAAAELQPERSVCVSSACSSTQVAVCLADRWLRQGLVDHVLVLAADAIGPFITNGFTALKALSPNKVRPFAADRSGLQLGEAAVAIWLTSEPTDISLVGAATVSEGYAATRPSHNGQGLTDAIAVVLSACTQPIDAVIAHGTGTHTNDAVEDRVLSATIGTQVPITATKWAVGHCMGASGAVDMIVACEALRRGQLPRIMTCHTVDPGFNGNYAAAQSPHAGAPQNILMTSLGFGGVNAAMILAKTSSDQANTPAKSSATQELHLASHLLQVDLPTDAVPPWANKVERWYQLDKAAQALPAAYARLQQRVSRPDAIFLASPEASNHTDRNFVAQGALHPAKFVHTLPNIRASSLLQLMDWRGPVYTIQGGQTTLASALDEAAIYVSASDQIAWVVFYLHGDAAQVALLELSAKLEAQYEHCLLRSHDSKTASKQLTSNGEILAFLQSSTTGRLAINPHLSMVSISNPAHSRRLEDQL